MGDLAADSISSITCMFNTNSSLIGAATLVDMRIDSTSVWNVDGDAALAGLTNIDTCNATSVVIGIVTVPGGDSGVSPAWLRVW